MVSAPNRLHGNCLLGHLSLWLKLKGLATDAKTMAVTRTHFTFRIDKDS